MIILLLYMLHQKLTFTEYVQKKHPGTYHEASWSISSTTNVRIIAVKESSECSRMTNFLL